ncbi:ammonium transporter [Arthrobacter sp. JZ12]|uniref:ammonium transporter n=1 Tax=Arthrobacter sp. JZ12 TaxID=2654190 RepID=UPI002B48788F|nr:ammonium transporter [Arthrobacter sp. JZ12]WRH26261.1 ammonium transporter [Arthrobacter sp. JZ12]
MDGLTPGGVWLVVATALVMLMTPALAFFYAGMTRVRSTLNMIMMSLAAMALAGLTWLLRGSSMATSEASALGMFGDPFANLAGLAASDSGDLLGMAFNAAFAIVTVAIISGSIADRARFGAWCLFVPLWVTLAYAPMAYAVWNGGILSADGAIGQWAGEAIDFAGGTVIHMNAGMAALVLALILGARSGFGKQASHQPHNLPMVVLGAALLWIGWFGFNVGAAGDDRQAAVILLNTIAAPAAAVVSWLAVERIRDGRPTTFGAASAIVAGLVAISPACADVTIPGAIAIGLATGVASCLAIRLKYRLGYDDSLDVVAVHLVTGFVGTVALGFFAIPGEESAGGLFYGGGTGQLWSQLVATGFALAYSGLVTAVLALVIHKVIGFRVASHVEEEGVDLHEHSESAYAPGALVGAPSALSSNQS